MAQPLQDIATEAIDAEAAFDRLVCSIVAKIEAGETIDLSAMRAQSPEHAQRLAQVLPALEAMATLGADKSGLLDGDLFRPINGSSETNEAPSGILGDFRIVREIGRGGMGVVYEAEQISLGRRVALKVLPFAAMLGEQQLQRFKNEARAAATLKHPHIVSVYSIGCDRGVHYYAMELVEGESLDRALHRMRSAECGMRNLRENPSHSPDSAIRIPNSAIETATTPVAALSTHGPTGSSGYFRNVARLGIEAADALQHAHDLGIIHRDIKPANLLVDAHGKLWITDFGLARIEADAGLTMSGDMLGTLRYMSPEQALGQGVADQRADVYSLGVTLYELTTLRPAYAAADRKQLLHDIASADPASPRHIHPQVPIDLDTIIRKAIERDAADRYGCAKDLADDLRRFLASEPIRARRASLASRAMKWSRRHHTLMTAMGMLAVILAGVLAVAAIFIERSRATAATALEQSSRHRERLAELLYTADVSLASQAWNDNDLSRALELLEHQVPGPGGVDRRDLEWYFLRRLCTSKFVPFASISSPIYDFAISPDASQLAAVGQDAVLRVFDLRTQRILTQIDTSQREVNGVAYLPDGETIVTTGDDGTVKLWRGLQAQPWKTIKAHDGIAYDVVYSQQENCIITCGEDGQIKLWDPATGELSGIMSGHTAPATALAVSHDGTILASASRDKTFRLWSLDERRERHNYQDFGRGISLTFDLQDKRLFVGTVANLANQILTFALDTNQLFNITLPVKETTSLAVSPDGQLLAAGTDEGVIWAWGLDSSSQLASKNRIWAAHAGAIGQLAFTPDGKQLVSAGDDGNIRFWENPTKRMDAGQLEVLGEVKSVAAVAQQPLLAVAGSEGVGLIDVPTGKLVEQLADGGSDYTYVAVSADGAQFAAAERDCKISVWRIDAPPPRKATDFPIDYGDAITFSPNGSMLTLVCATSDDGVVHIDLETGDKRSGFVTHGCNEFAWSPDGRFHVAAENQSDAIVVHDASGKLLHRIKHHTTTITGLAVSPNSRWIASADDGCLLALWNAQSGERVWTSRTSVNGGTRGFPVSLAFTPNGGTLLVLSKSGAIDAFHVATGRSLLQFEDAWIPSAGLQLCAGGKYLCMVSGSRLRIIETGYELPHAIAD